MHCSGTAAEIMLASKGKAGELLKTEFPDLPFYDHAFLHHTLFAKEIPGIYSDPSDTSHAGCTFHGTPVAEKIHFSPSGRHCYIRQLLRTFQQQRFFPSFVSHQISPLLPAGLKWMEPFVHTVLRLFIRSFDRCWIPDEKDPSLNLTGRSFSPLPGFPGILSLWAFYHGFANTR